MMAKSAAASRLEATKGKTSRRLASIEKAATTGATKVCAVELPKFRYIDDVARFIEKIADEVNELDGLIKVQQKNLAYLRNPKDNVTYSLVKAASFEFVVTDGNRTGRSHLKRKIDPELTKVVVPNLDKLKTQYGLLEELYERHRAIEAAEAQLAAQFPERVRGSGYQEVVDSMTALKEKVASRMSEVFKFLNDIAGKHVPKTFEKYMKAVVLEVQEHVLMESSDLFLYVSVTPEGEIMFTYYVMLINATNDEGKVTPHLYISLQWIVGKSTKVQINHEYELPNKLMLSGGEEVGSAGEAVQAISRLLDLEDFASTLGTVPLSTQLQRPVSEITPEMFTYRDFISKVTIDSDQLVFKLRPGVTPAELKEIQIPLFQEIRTRLFKNSRSVKLKMVPTTKAITFQLYNVAQRGEVSIHDAEFLVDKFGLNDSRLRKVVNLLNQSLDDQDETK